MDNRKMTTLRTRLTRLTNTAAMLRRRQADVADWSKQGEGINQANNSEDDGFRAGSELCAKVSGSAGLRGEKA